MTTYEYKGFNEAGRVRRGLIEALDHKDAREKLVTSGVLAERLVEAGAKKGARIGSTRNVFTAEVRAMIYRELGALLRAGLPLSHALQILINSPELGRNRMLLAAIRDRVLEGESLASSLVSISTRVTRFEEAIIEVGEKAGNLEEVMDRLASFLEQQKAMQDRVTSALIYPAVVLVLAVGIGLAVMGLMIPRIGKLLIESQVPMPMLTQVMLGGSQVLVVSFFPAMFVLIAMGILVRRKLSQNAEFRRRVDRTIFRIPLIGKGYTALVNLRFSRTLALLIRGGIPLLEGLALAGRATGSAWLRQLVDEQIVEIRHGRSLAAALRHVPPLQWSLPGWVEAGEAGGDLSHMLECAGSRYQQQWDRIVSRSLSLLEPMLVLGVGAFVLLVALSVLLPVMAMNQQL